MVQRQNNVAEPIPPFYVKTLSSLEKSLNNTIAAEKDAKKKMNATNNRALNAMKQKIKKAVKEYATEIKQFQDVGAYAFPLSSVFNSSRIRKLSSANTKLPSNLKLPLLKSRESLELLLQVPTVKRARMTSQLLARVEN